MREGQTRDEGGRVELRKQGRRKGGPMYIILKLISEMRYLDWNDLDITDVSPQFNH